jgi:hypothetical protein
VERTLPKVESVANSSPFVGPVTLSQKRTQESQSKLNYMGRSENKPMTIAEPEQPPAKLSRRTGFHTCCITDF